jgi:hypothetical protein
MNAPIRVAVTGANGQVGYNLLFRIASGAMFGAESPVGLPSSRRVDLEVRRVPQKRRWIMFMIGGWARKALGLRWGFLATVPMEFLKA